MKTKKIFFLAVVVLLGSLILPLVSQAVTISPPLIEIEASRGQIINQTLKVRNEDAQPMTYYLKAERFIAAGEGGAAKFVSGEDVDLASWISFPYPSLVVKGGETVEVPFVINVPDYAGPGGHYAAVFLSTLPPDTKNAPTQVSIATKIGSLVLVRIAGDVKENAELTEFATTSKSFNSLPVNFSLKVRNNGNIHIKPMGSITIKNLFGSEAAKIEVNQDAGNVLPDQVRKFDATWVKNTAEQGATTFFGKYRQEKENYAFGKYTAEMNLVYGTAGKTMVASTSFWVIPWHVLAVNALILIVIIIIVYFLIKRYNAWILSKYSKPAVKKSKK